MGPAPVEFVESVDANATFQEKLRIFEKPEGEVSYLWKGCQLLTYIICITSGFCSCLAIGSTNGEFKNGCVLYANLTVKLTNQNNTVTILPNNSWGDNRYCNFCQYCPVASVIFAGIWATLFMMCVTGRGGSSNSNLPQAWRIVPLAVLFNLVFVILSSITVAYIFGGFSAFCSSLISNMAQAGAKISTCDEIVDYIWEGVSPSNFLKQILVAEVSSVITLVGWTGGLVLLITRCVTHADFTVVSETPERISAQATELAGTGSGTCYTSDRNPLIAVEIIHRK